MAMVVSGSSLECLRFLGGECEVRGFVPKGAGFADRGRHGRLFALRVRCGKKNKHLAGKLAKVQELVKAQRDLVLSSQKVSTEQGVDCGLRGDVQAEDSIQIAFSNPDFLERIIKNLEDLQAEVESLNVKAKKKKKIPSQRSVTGIATVTSTNDDIEEEDPIVAQIRALCSATNSATSATREVYERGPIELKDTPDGRVIVDTASSLSSLAIPDSREANTTCTIQVCTVGKCKKEGSQQILASLQGCIPESSGISVTSCKCMGKCKNAPNVRVKNSQGQTQLHSHVSLDDIDTLLELHFGVQSSGSQSNGTPHLFVGENPGVAAA